MCLGGATKNTIYTCSWKLATVKVKSIKKPKKRASVQQINDIYSEQVCESQSNGVSHLSTIGTHTHKKVPIKTLATW